MTMGTIYLTVRERKRYVQILKELSHMSREGWRYAGPDDYVPLEKELTILLQKMDLSDKYGL